MDLWGADMKGNIRGAIILSGLLLTLACCALYLIAPPFVDSARNRSTDTVMSLAYRPPPSSSVAIVDIDETSLSLYGQWPWPRDRVAQLLRTVAACRPAAVGLDLILAEPDGTAPRQEESAAPSPLSPLKEKPGLDQELAATLANGPFVLAQQFVFGETSRGAVPGGLHSTGVVWIRKPGASAADYPFFTASGAVGNLPLFAGAVKRSGFLNAAADGDGIVRRVPMLIRFRDNLYPSLPLAVLMQRHDRSQVVVLRQRSGALDLVVAHRTIPLDEHGNLVPQFSRTADAPERISAADLMEGKVPAQQLRDKMVIIGASAAGLEPVYQTPAAPLLSHSDLQAQVLDSLWTGRWAIRSGSTLLWEVLAGLLLGAVITCVTLRMRTISGALAAGACLGGTWVGAVLVLQGGGYLVSPLLPSAVVILDFGLLTLVKSLLAQGAAQQVADSTLVLLKSSEKNLDSIIKTVPDIIFRLDSAGHITFVSPAVARYVESEEALLGRGIFDLVLPEDLGKAQHRLNERRTGERATRGLELRLLLSQHHEGKTEPGYFSVSAEGIYCSEIRTPENFLGTQGIMRDITEQKKLEETLLQAQKMEVIGRMAAGVAHDLNNILVGLVAYPDLLLLELPHDSPLREKIALIQKSGKRAAAIVQDLLTLGRRGVRTSEIVSLNDVIEEYLASPECGELRRRHPETVIKRALAPDALCVKGSKVHLAKAVMNIVLNAAEAMPSGGDITVSTCSRFLETPYQGYEEIPPGEYTCVCIADEGVGIDREDLHRIFDPFFTTKKMHDSGSGLGMTIVWTTIKDHGGYLDLQSSEGRGTQIVLYLPATREQEEPALLIGQEQYLGSERILIVDDNPDQLYIAARMLAKLGYAVSSVASGAAAVAHVRGQEADLVVLDMVMPEMDGLETYRQIIDLRPGQRAIITSGFSEPAKVAALQALGAGGYLQKPYTLEKLGVAVRRELDRPQEAGVRQTPEEALPTPPLLQGEGQSGDGVKM